MASLPADPKWKLRTWQTYHETKEHYIKHLLLDIKDSKAMIDTYDASATRHPGLLEVLADQIESERKILNEYQDELRKVISDVE